MTRSQYLSRFSFMIRWRLSYGEASDIISDYEDIFNQNEKTEEEVCHELGKPGKAARLLGSRFSYLCWLAVFTILAIPVIALFYSMLSFSPLQSWIGISCPQLRAYTLLFLSAVSLIISLIWFRLQRRDQGIRGTRQRCFPVSQLLVLFLFVLAATGVAAYAFYFVRKLYSFQPVYSLAHKLSALLLLLGSFSAVAALAALVKSRISDRRWSSVFVCGLTVLLISTFFYQILTSLDLHPDANNTFESLHWILMKELKGYGVIGITGLLGTGVSLC